jgi:hypothetical protein
VEAELQHSCDRRLEQAAGHALGWGLPPRFDP